jgi:hypothetical protein
MKATPQKAPAKATKAPAKKAAKPANPTAAIAPRPPQRAREQAAAVVGIAKHTLEKHYAAELTDGKAKMLARVVNNLYSNATQTRDMKAANTAAIFFLKQHGWRDDGMSAQVKATQTATDGTEQVMTFTLKIGERGEG